MSKETRAKAVAELGELDGEWLNEWIGREDAERIIERVTVEAQAQMPCYRMPKPMSMGIWESIPERCPESPSLYFPAAGPCPSCRARIALKVPV